mgnify:CR=1 FL=1
MCPKRDTESTSRAEVRGCCSDPFLAFSAGNARQSDLAVHAFNTPPTVETTRAHTHARKAVSFHCGKKQVSVCPMAVAVSLLVALQGAIELTPENWDKETSGKTAFVKFLAPW